MAKTRSIVKFSGTISDVTFVDSVAYGPHSRAKRGSKTPITLAEGMKVSASNQQEANKRAKIMFDAVNEFAPGFKDGTFWTRLLSIFRKQKKAGIAYNYGDFNMMEMRIDYATSKQGSFMLDDLTLNYKLLGDSGYRLSMLRIATDGSLLIPYPHEIKEVFVASDENAGEFQFEFTPLPPGAAVLYALQCEQLWRGKPSGALKGRSVRFFRGI